MKRKIAILTSMFAIMALGFLGMRMLAAQAEAPAAPNRQQEARFVRTQSVRYADIRAGITASGRLNSQRDLDLMAEVQGKILAGSVPLKKGQSFREGQLLLRILNDEAVLALKGLKSRFLNSIANLLPDFKIDHPASYPAWLAFFNAIDLDKPMPDMPQPRSDQEKIYLASRNILADFYAIKSEELRQLKYFLHAPFNGTYADVVMEVGSVANPGARLARIISTDRLELEVPVDATNATWIRLGDAVTVTDKAGSHQWGGTVSRKSDFIDPNTQSVAVFVGVNQDPGHPLYNGQFLTATFPGGSWEQAMEMPRNAVFNQNQVFIVQDGRLAKREIRVLKYNDETLIFDGLPQGAELVVEPLANARENDPVQTLEPEA